MLAPNPTLKIGPSANRFSSLNRLIVWIAVAVVLAAGGLYWWIGTGTATTLS
jgi:hypothetical protein